MKEIKKFGVLSMGKIYAITMGFLGAILGIFFSLFSFAMGAFAGSGFGADAGMIGAAMGIFGLIGFPILYGIIGFIAGILGAAIYNLAAKWVGGIEIEIVEKETNNTL